MRNFIIHLRNTVVSALVFGVGFLLGDLVGLLIFRSEILTPVRDLFEAGRFALGLTLILVVVGLMGAISGAVGGLALSYVNQSTNRLGYAWRTALSFGLSYPLVLLPLMFAIALISFYNLSESAPISLMIPLAAGGFVFGAVSGLILGILTVGRAAWRVLLAGALGFALGGAGLGYSLWGYYFGAPDVQNQDWPIIAGFFVLGAFGGGALGFLYSWLTHREIRPSLFHRFVAWYKRSKLVPRLVATVLLIITILALRGLWLISPFSATTAPLNSILKSNTVGTHWSTPAQLAGQLDPAWEPPAVFAADTGQVAVTWSNGGDIYYRAQTGADQGWSTPVNVSNSASTESTGPQLVIDHAGGLHLVWTESTAEAGQIDVFYSHCRDSTCTPPASLSNLASLDCLTFPSLQNDSPAIAIDEVDTLMVAWRNGRQSLLYSTWPNTTGPPATPAGCILTGDPNHETNVGQPRLSSAAAGAFDLVFEQPDDTQKGQVYLSHYAGKQWDSSAQRLGEGRTPEIFTGQAGQIHLAWCGPNGSVNYRSTTGPVETLPFSPCAGRPGLTQAGADSVRLVWYTDQVKNVGGVAKPNQLLSESVKTASGWTEPAIIAQTGLPAQPAVAAGPEGTLHLAWIDKPGENGELFYASHVEYECQETDLSDLSRVIYNVVSQEKYRPASNPVPFCHNRYDQLIFAPNPDPAFSAEPPASNGPFDQFAILAKSARYEVNYSTMWYDADKNQDSPGFVVAQAVAELYENLKADPERYPRGLTVRILLGNPPGFSLFPTLSSQVRQVLEDLRAAGVPEMKNPDLGWKLEVANFGGSWPHSHTKIMVVDGKTVIAAGYNFQYAHFPKDHPSGQGKDKVDLGLQVTGPVAQATLQAFDDLWAASTGVYCANLDPTSKYLWMFSCRIESPSANHGPEVRQYYLPDTNSTAFSLHRTQKFQEADEAYYQALASATASIDTIQVNFTLEAICDLGVLLEVCNFTNRIDPLGAIMTAVETNQAKVRVLVKETPIDGIENRIAIKAFRDQLAAKGLSDLVEFRFFNGKLVHSKAALIDQELLIVGSQNYHYSAWGDQGLTEYNLAIEDPAAVKDFQRFFNYEWEQANPVK